MNQNQTKEDMPKMNLSVYCCPACGRIQLGIDHCRACNTDMQSTQPLQEIINTSGPRIQSLRSCLIKITADTTGKKGYPIYASQMRNRRSWMYSENNRPKGTNLTICKNCGHISSPRMFSSEELCSVCGAGMEETREPLSKYNELRSALTGSQMDSYLDAVRKEYCPDRPKEADVKRQETEKTYLPPFIETTGIAGGDGLVERGICGIIPAAIDSFRSIASAERYLWAVFFAFLQVLERYLENSREEQPNAPTCTEFREFLSDTNYAVSTKYLAGQQEGVDLFCSMLTDLAQQNGWDCPEEAKEEKSLLARLLFL